MQLAVLPAGLIAANQAEQKQGKFSRLFQRPHSSTSGGASSCYCWRPWLLKGHCVRLSGGGRQQQQKKKLTSCSEGGALNADIITHFCMRLSTSIRPNQLQRRNVRKQGICAARPGSIASEIRGFSSFQQVQLEERLCPHLQPAAVLRTQLDPGQHRHQDSPIRWR